MVQIDWQDHISDDWSLAFSQAYRPPLTQSYTYGRAVASISVQRPHYGLIRFQGEIVGVVQILMATIPGRWIEAVACDRGPVWLAPDPPRGHVDGFWRALAHDFPRRFGRVRRMIPELGQGFMTQDEFCSLGYIRRQNLSPYQTFWVDLGGGEDAWTTRLHKNWRYDLRRATEVQVQKGNNPAVADQITLLADRAALRHHYHRPDRRLLGALHRTAATRQELVTVLVGPVGNPWAAGVFIRHGSAATWQTGWVGDAGRAHHANTRMLAAALTHLAQMGVTDVDLGGYNDQDAVGVRRFKAGLGGQDVTLLGAFG